MKPAKLLIAVAAGLTLTACAGARTRFYALEPAGADSGPRADYAGPPVRVDAVHIPDALDRPELVRDLPGHRFVVSDNDHWAGPLVEMFRQVLTQDLLGRLPEGKVVFPDAPKPPGASGLVVDILAVAPVDGRMTMQVSWTVLPNQGRGGPGPAPAPVRQRSARLSTPAMGDGVSGDAAELSALAGQLATAIAADLASPGR